MRSTSAPAPSSAPTSARSVESMNCTRPSGSPAAVHSRAMISANTAEVACASDPERSTTALLDLMHTAAMSTVTLGRDS